MEGVGCGERGLKCWSRAEVRVKGFDDIGAM